jgi:hypothetical protein
MKSSGVVIGGERIRYMQDNTGIKDKFGVPIFVGDTVAKHTDNRYEVVYERGEYKGKIISIVDNPYPLYVGLDSGFRVVHIRRT